MRQENTGVMSMLDVPTLLALTGVTVMLDLKETGLPVEVRRAVFTCIYSDRKDCNS